jgi:hypothetical protein
MGVGTIVVEWWGVIVGVIIISRSWWGGCQWLFVTVVGKAVCGWKLAVMGVVAVSDMGVPVVVMGGGCGCGR